jgi:hypothetical protein
MNHERPPMLTAAAIGGAFLGITSALPVIGALNCACCGLIVAGGVIATYLYLRDFPSGLPYPTYGDITLLGLYTGLIGAAVWVAIEIPLSFLQMRFLPEMLERLPAEVVGDAEMPSAFRELERLFSGGFGGVFVVVAVISALTRSLVFAILGSILGMALFGRRAAAPPSQVYPPSYAYPQAYAPPPAVAPPAPPTGGTQAPQPPQPPAPERQPAAGSEPETPLPPEKPGEGQGNP